MSVTPKGSKRALILMIGLGAFTIGVLFFSVQRPGGKPEPVISQAMKSVGSQTKSENEGAHDAGSPPVDSARSVASSTAATTGNQRSRLREREGEQSTSTPERNVSPALDGVQAATVIDWDTVEASGPMPRSLPTRSAADAIDAGFPREWFERAFGDVTIDSLIDRHHKNSTVKVLPLIDRIISHSKAPGDLWANYAESDLRTLIRQNAEADGELVSRVFCSDPGCIVYLERARSAPRAMTAILSALVDEPRTSQYGIGERNIFLSGAGPWNLIVISRP
jgi:hypothetical protein